MGNNGSSSSKYVSPGETATVKVRKSNLLEYQVNGYKDGILGGQDALECRAENPTNVPARIVAPWMGSWYVPILGGKYFYLLK